MVDSTATRKAFTVPEIKPLDQYDFNRAKICASLGWLLAKSYGTAENVPLDLREPFYQDQYEQEHIKPPVTQLLLSSELYCRVYGQLLGARGHAPSEGPPRDGPSLLCLLAKRGAPPKDRDVPVTEADLRHKPIRMSAHLAVMDALMSAVAMETVSAVKMPGEVGWENAVLYWINRLNQKLKENTEGDPPLISPPSTDLQPAQPSCPTRWYWKLVPIRYRKDKLLPKLTPTFPLVTGVKDLSNGCAVAAVIHFYCPDLLRLEDVCLKDTMSVADSLYNLQLIRDFCESCLKICCPLLLEDLLYTPPGLRVNLLSFMAELLEWFEVRRPDFVQPRETLDLADISVLPECATPTSGNSNSASPAFIFKQPFLPISSPVSPGGKEGVGRPWSRKQISRPLSAVSFSIPFGLDSDVDVVMGNKLGAITRSVSSDSLHPALPGMTRAPYTPPEDLSHLLSKAPEGPGPPNGPLPLLRASRGAQTRGGAVNGVGVAVGEGADLPIIEEALQIIHCRGKLEPRLLPEGAPDGFFLHDDPALARLSSSAPSRSGMLYRPSGAEGSTDGGAEPRTSRRPRRTSSGSRDDDSVLRDGSVDSDASEEPSNARSTPATPANARGQPAGNGADAGADGGVRMTSFAERKKKMTPADAASPGADGGPQMTTWAQRSEESPSKSPALSTEMSELGARLEEKRKAIEAQKKRIEAIFAKHRQRLGKSALLQLKKEQLGEAGGQEEGEGEGEGEGDEALAGLSLEERLQRMEREAEEEAEGEPELPPVEQPGNCKPPPRLDKQVTFSMETREGEGQPVYLDEKEAEPKRKGAGLDEKGAGSEEKGAEPAPLGEYGMAVSRLNAALSSLQNDMQRLSQQQRLLMRRKTAPATQPWVIPAAPKKSAAAVAGSAPLPRLSRKSTRDLASASSSPSPSRKAHATPPKSPQTSQPRRAKSVPPKSPKHHQARPLDLKFPPLARTLTPTQNVDTLPHLRRVSPSQCQVQTTSSFRIGAPQSPQDRPQPGPLPRPAEDSSSETGSSEDPAIFCLELDSVGPVPRAPAGRDPGGGGSSGAPSECSFESDCYGGKRGSLMEISLSSLRGGAADEGEGPSYGDDEGPENFSDSTSDQTDPETRGGVGFFFKDDTRPEDEMAQRRAALLQKQQKRAEEMKKRREQEKEKETRPTSSSEEPRARWMEDGAEGVPWRGGSGAGTPGTPQRRGGFTRQEYERRHQLKLMDELDKVLRQKPGTARTVKKQRPKTVFHDDSALSRSPAKGFMGSKLSKVYSHSSLNLSSMANDTSSNKKSPSQSQSPSRLMSPSRLANQNGEKDRLANQNGEKDWENASTASSPASIPEYTGPKLFKEPSFKSNKFIIHNALSRCCLAGKVNEQQRSKIVEEMEKCTANHFLILFRDSSCQFRAVYTMNPETEEMMRLTGIGPRVISAALVESIYKYSSDRKQFNAIPSKTMSMSVDAFTIPGHLWQSKRPGTPKKPSTPK